MIMCQKRGCIRAADCAVKICVPAVGAAEEAPAAADVLMAVHLCNAHLEEATAEPFFKAAGGTLKPLLRIAAKGTELDFDRAYVTGVALASEEHGLIAQAEGALRN